MPVISVDHLSKSYVTTKRPAGFGAAVRALFSRANETVDAVKEVSFEVAEGELIGFLGPNGAGKTTTLKMLSGILAPTSGRATVLGYTPFDRRADFLRQIALVMGNRQQLWWDLPAWESFVVLGELYDVPKTDFNQRVKDLVERLGLDDKVHTQVRKLSLGERMKCELVAALIHRPRVLFLDEPTIGLDVVSQVAIREFLRDFNQMEGCTILLTSHYMRDVQELCERVVIVDHGSVAFDGTLRRLTDEHAGSKRFRLTFGGRDALPDLAAYGTVVETDGRSVALTVPTDGAAATTAALLNTFDVSDIVIEDVPIEDVIRKLFASNSPHNAAVPVP